MSEQGTLLACVPRMGFLPVEGSHKKNCADCGIGIWVSPASRKVAGEGAIYCCLACSGKRITEDPNPEFAEISDEQIEELRKAILDD